MPAGGEAQDGDMLSFDVPCLGVVPDLRHAGGQLAQGAEPRRLLPDGIFDQKGLIYCGNCGAKMHVYKSTRKGHTYLYYRCSEGCGASVVKLEDVDKVAKAYVQELLSEDTQRKVAQVLRNYKGHEEDRTASFKAAVAKKISEKEAAYNNLLANMAAAVLPPEVVADLSAKMQALKSEISELQAAEPPVDYSVDTIREWLII